MKVVGYARTSWREQIRGDFPSVEVQEATIRAFCARVGVHLTTVHIDTGLSLAQSTYNGLVSVLDSMDDEWEALLVVSPCRLDVARFKDELREELIGNGKRTLVADEVTAQALARQKPVVQARSAPSAGVSTGAPRRVDGTQARRRREVAERLLRGREEGARQGKHQSGPAPYGYRRDYTRRSTQGVLLVPDVAEGEIVQLIFREYLRLRSMKRLIKLLDERGLRTRRGKRWSRAGVSWILKNETYVGRVHFGDIRTKGLHRSLVPPILFNKVQKLMRVNNKRNREDEDGDGEDGDDVESVAMTGAAKAETAAAAG